MCKSTFGFAALTLAALNNARADYLVRHATAARAAAGEEHRGWPPRMR